MKTFSLLLGGLAAMLISAAAPAASDASRALPAPKVIIFDVNETLLDLEPVRKSVAAALQGRDDLLGLWFSTMLHHSLVDTVSGRYHDFGEIGVAALMMVAASNAIALSEKDARAAITAPLLSLPPHADVRESIVALKAQGFKIVSLTNSSSAGVKAQFENADLIELFDHRLSIGEIEIYKPDLRAYRWALEKIGVKPAEAMLVAAHGWDIAGAKAAGMQATFVRRPGKVLYPLADKPDYTVKNLRELVKILSTKQ